VIKSKIICKKYKIPVKIKDLAKFQLPYNGTYKIKAKIWDKYVVITFSYHV